MDISALLANAKTPIPKLLEPTADIYNTSGIIILSKGQRLKYLWKKTGEDLYLFEIKSGPKSFPTVWLNTDQITILRLRDPANPDRIGE